MGNGVQWVVLCIAKAAVTHTRIWRRILADERRMWSAIVRHGPCSSAIIRHRVSHTMEDMPRFYCGLGTT